LGVSYVRKYKDSDLAREEFGGNFRYFYKFLSPYAQVRYDRLSETFDEMTYGLDIFPLRNLMIKGEYYQTYPTFDATSIYSVFAVDRYREYLARAEYSFEFPVTAFVSYKRQIYEEADNADVYTIGARVYPIEHLTVTGDFNYRMGYSGFDASNGNSKGKLVGYELSGSYTVMKALTVFGGLQYDTYNRPELNGLNSATRYWAGGQWAATKDLTVNARIENNINENFDHRTLGRVSLDWTL
jgi:predicted porin